MRIGRREFLAGSCGTVAGLALTACGADRFSPPPFVPGDSGRSLLADRHVVSACGQCPGGCGVRIRVAGDAAVGIAGLPSHPVNRGRLCSRGLGGLQILYHPDRLRGPMRRDGPRGSGRFVPIGWEEAIDTLAGRLKGLREAGRPQGLALLTGYESGVMADLFGRFALAFGTPNHTPATASGRGVSVPRWITQGFRDDPAYDWERVRYVLSFDSNWLEATDPPEVYQRACAFLHRGTPGRRGKVVEVSPRFTFTAAQCDEWVPIRLGTGGALALAIAHVLLREGRVDEAGIEAQAVGFSEWTDEVGEVHPGFREVVLAEYPPEWAESVTGIAAGRIRRLAREIADNRPAVVLGRTGPPEYTNSLTTGIAVQHLNALLGAYGVPGGVIPQREPPYAPGPELVPDDVAAAGAAMPRADGAGTLFPLADGAERMLPRAILSGEPYPIEALLLHRNNPVFDHPAVAGWREALEKVPFVASLSPFLDQTSRYADLILPDHTWLEKIEDRPVAPSTGFAVVSLRSPVVKPLYDTRHAGDVLLDVARRVGGPVAAAFPWGDFRAAVSHAVSGLAGRGSLAGIAAEGTLDAMTKAGFWSAEGEARPGRGEGLATPSGKFLFAGLGPVVAGEVGSARGAQAGTLGAPGLPGIGDRAFLSRYVEPRFAGGPDYPLHLITYRLPTLDESNGAVQPLLREVGSGFFDDRWERRLEVHPETARRLGLRDGERVRVVSPAARIEVRMRVFPGIPADAVTLPIGTGGPADASLLLADLTAPHTGEDATCSTRVRLEKAS